MVSIMRLYTDRRTNEVPGVALNGDMSVGAAAGIIFNAYCWMGTRWVNIFSPQWEGGEGLAQSCFIHPQKNLFSLDNW